MGTPTAPEPVELTELPPARHRSLPVWVLDRDGGLDFFLGRIALWPYFYTVMLVQHVRARKARAITVRRVDQ